MDFSVTDEQIAFKQTAKQFATKELQPNAATWDRESYFPVEVIKKAAELGFLGLYTSTDYDGLGLSRLDSAMVFEALAWGDTSVASYMTIHNMVCWMIGEYGSASLAQQYVPQMVSGELLGSYCLTEANAGSDAASLRTKADREGN